MPSRIETCCQNCGEANKKLFQCRLCHVVSYCSQSCETTDAECHGRVCFENPIKKSPKTSQEISGYMITNCFGSFFIYMDNECFTEKVVRQVITLFPYFDVSTNFSRVPHSNIHKITQRKQVMLAQISKKEEDSKNIFIKDIFGCTLYMIFNFKSELFNWSELSLGKMICIKNPVFHTFDGKLVLCINRECDIKVL